MQNHISVANIIAVLLTYQLSTMRCTVGLLLLAKARSTPATMSKQHCQSKWHQLLYRLSRDNLKHFYLPNLFHHFKLLSHIFVPCPRSYLAYATLISTFYYCYYFDIVAKNGNNVKATSNVVEATFDFVAFYNVASTLLLVWMGFNASMQPKK